MKRLFNKICPALLTLICMLSSMSRAEVITGHTFQQWGEALLMRIEDDFGRWDGLYYHSLADRFPDYAWGQGVMFNALTAAAKVDPSRLPRVIEQADEFHARYWCTQDGTSGYNASYGSCGDRYYDDNAWIALALAELYELTGDAKYLTWARQTVAFSMTGENGPGDTPDGGIRWKESNTSGASICATAPTCLANLMIYQLTGIESYKTDGMRLYDWLITADAYRYSTGIFHETNQGPLGYQTAVVTQAAVRMYRITGDAGYLAEAQSMARAMEAEFINSSTHALEQTGKWGGHDMTNAYVELYEVDHDPQWLSVAAGYLKHLYDNWQDNGLYAFHWNGAIYKEDNVVIGVFSNRLIDNASVARAFWKMASAPGAVLPTSGSYIPTLVTPYLAVGSDWVQTERAVVNAGDTVTLKAQAAGSGTLRWEGPRGFTAATAEVTIPNIQPGEGGYYAAVFTSTNNVESFGALHLAVNTAVTLYQHCPYGGWLAKFGAGTYTAADIEAAGGKNNDASSLRIEPGFKVTFFDGDHFTGASLVKTADDDCLVDEGWNDRITSMIIEGGPSPAAHWQFNENGGSVAGDASGSGYTGRLVNMDPGAWTVGKQCGGLSLDGVDDYVEIPDFSGIPGPAARTCMAWIKTGTAPGEIITWGEDYPGGRWIIRVNEGGQLRAEVQGGNIIGTTPVNDGQWHHVAVVLVNDGHPDITEAVLYVDGRPDPVSASVSRLVNSGSLQTVQIGMYYVGQRFFDGLIDEVRIYGRALTAAEIQAIYRLHALAADIASDDAVDLNDFAVLAETWQTASCQADLTCDCRVDFDDLMILIDEWLLQLPSN